MWWCLGLLTISLLSWSLFSTCRVLYPERKSIPAPQPLPSYTCHPLLTPEGEVFDVWLLEDPSPRARVLICHGYYADRYQVLTLAQRLREHHYEVLLCELRGHGSRPGPCTLGVKERDDAALVLRWARTRADTPSLPVGILGFSMGAAVACQVAANIPDIRAVVVDSIYARLFPVLARVIHERYHLPSSLWAWITWWSLELTLRRRLALNDPVHLASQLRQPLLAIQGGKDQRVAPELRSEFYQRWAGPKEQWADPSVGHVGMFAKHPDAYVNRVVDFFNRTLT